MCDGIESKSAEFLHRRWGSAKRSKNRVKKAQGDGDDEEKASARSSSDLQADQDTRSLDDRLCAPTERRARVSGSLTSIPSEPQQPAATLTSSTPAPAASNDPLTCEQGQLIGAEQVNDAGINTPVAITLSSAAATYQLAQWDLDTEAQFRLIAVSLGKGCKGKWKLFHSEYLKRYPGSKLGQNAVRMRLRDQQVAAKTVPAAPTSIAPSDGRQEEQATTSSAPASNKRPRPSCDSCRKTKRRCGPNSDNQHCEQRQAREGQQNITSFLS
ncbi:hypothetical protein PHYSODRAFT_305823 [Phytophthora sojae]|uniref:Uncharacterized protein n=1 Tax=Phytophthora sojae (strain P6497) TaxID=1094619 RepID=G5A6S3_PHYSP|nr:hypothetical protein PHYSODRAFT_305823 [Phytophthora sojae]EGZ09028.1 hypothetical protein PHYSODRAFT_305823 [Phytophthora sojae]|eukprot:XP_009535661.1 hypothetical protein PHYSODRAFT_305823 [Phytophthora sojae]